MLPPIRNPTASMRRKSFAMASHAAKKSSSCNDLDIAEYRVEQQNGFTFSKEKSSQLQKHKLREDLYLTDRTVSLDDPRIKDSFEAMTRIRHRTGFDPSLIKNKCWAAKVSKDLARGLAKMDEIEAERKRKELGCIRNMDAERLTLRKRLEWMAKSSSSGAVKCRNRSKSESFINFSLASAQKDLSKCLCNLTTYITKLEEQGGFITKTGRNEMAGSVKKAKSSGSTSADSFDSTDDNDARDYVFFSAPTHFSEPAKASTSKHKELRVNDSCFVTKIKRTRWLSDSECTHANAGVPPLPSGTIKTETDGDSEHGLKRSFFSAPLELNLLH